MADICSASSEGPIMRRAAFLFAVSLGIVLCTPSAIAHSVAADFTLSSEELAQVPIVRGLTGAEKLLLARSFSGEREQVLDNSSYAAAWRLTEWVEVFLRELAVVCEPRLAAVLVWLFGLSVSLWRWSAPGSQAETQEEAKE
jgi:hypothetical protein